MRLSTPELRMSRAVMWRWAIAIKDPQPTVAGICRPMFLFLFLLLLLPGPPAELPYSHSQAQHYWEL